MPCSTKTNVAPNTRLAWWGQIVVYACVWSAQVTIDLPRAHGDDAATIEQYLDRLGLSHIQMLHLEQVIARSAKPDEAAVKVKKLADLFASELLMAADDNSVREALLVRVQRLIDAHPTAKTPSLEVMLLQADYASAEFAAEKWLLDPADLTARQSAIDTLTRISPELNRHLNELEAETDKMIEQLEQSDDTDQATVIESKIARFQQVMGRARFYSGWSSYYLAVLENDASKASDLFAAAGKTFRDFLGIEETYENVNVEDLGLQSPAISRGVIGLSLAEAGVGDLQASRKCIEFLKSPSTPIELRQQQHFWYVQGLVNAKRFAEAAIYARDVLLQQSTAPLSDQGMLSVAVRVAISGMARASQDEDARELATVGISALVRYRQIDLARQLIAKYAYVLDESQDDFYLKWMVAQQAMLAAEQSKDRSRFESATTLLQQTLEHPVARTDLASASQVRYELAYCQFKLGQYDSAAGMFAGVASVLIPVDREMAANAVWLAFAAYQKSLAVHPENRKKAIEMLERLKRDFPESPHADSVDYQISLLKRAGQSASETMKELAAIDRDNENFLNAAYELCILAHQQWAGAKGSEKRDLAIKAAQQCQRFLTELGESPSPIADVNRKMKVLLLAADLALNGDPTKVEEATKLLLACSQINAQHSDLGLLSAEYHFRMLQLARIKEMTAAVNDHATWITQNAPGSPFELPSLILRAQHCDEAVKREGSTAIESAFQVYKRLVEVLNAKNPDQLANDKNARVALTRFAEYAMASGHYSEAAAAGDRLLEYDPKNRQYLKFSAQGHYGSGSFGAAVERYRTLVRGLPADSAQWYEAKYYQIAALMRIDREKGMQVFRQFQLIHQDLGPEPWKSKFEQLVQPQ